jgi:RimJ/RimL family protein N-acetyltransferase
MVDRINTPRLTLARADAGDLMRLRSIVEDRRVSDDLFLTEPSQASWVFPVPQSGQVAANDSIGTQRERFHSPKLLGHLRLAVRLRGNADPVGGVSICEGNLSYFLAPAYWGQGLGGEAVHAACALFRTQELHHLRARVLRRNLASRRILESVGFVFSGLILRARTPPVLQYRFSAAPARVATVSQYFPIVR